MAKKTLDGNPGKNASRRTSSLQLRRCTRHLFLKTRHFVAVAEVHATLRASRGTTIAVKNIRNLFELNLFILLYRSNSNRFLMFNETHVVDAEEMSVISNMERNEAVLVDAVEDLADETNRVVVFTPDIEGNDNILNEMSQIGGELVFASMMTCIEAYASAQARIELLSAELKDHKVGYEQVASSEFWFKSFFMASPVKKDQRLIHHYAVFRRLYEKESKRMIIALL